MLVIRILNKIYKKISPISFKSNTLCILMNLCPIKIQLSFFILKQIMKDNKLKIVEIINVFTCWEIPKKSQVEPFESLIPI